MRFGKTQCTTCWAWSKSRTYVLANTVLDETYGTGVTVSDRYCPKCGDTVRFPPSDLDEEERSVSPRVAASMKGLVGFRCPGCGDSTGAGRTRPTSWQAPSLVGSARICTGRPSSAVTQPAAIPGKPTGPTARAPVPGPDTEQRQGLKRPAEPSIPHTRASSRPKRQTPPTGLVGR